MSIHEIFAWLILSGLLATILVIAFDDDGGPLI